MTSAAEDRGRTVEVAIVQHPPVLLDRAATIERVVEWIRRTAADGAQLVVFPETFVPGYPDHVWRLRSHHEGDRIAELHGRLLSEAVDLDRDGLAPVRSAAAEHGVTVMLGVHEVDGAASRASLFNTLVTIGPDGAVLNRHRKLVPTGPERMVWAQGDASGLRVLDLPIGRLGGLICWENYLPLARFALYAQGLQIHVAPTWDRGGTWIATMRHIAAEGRCWVLGAGCALRAGDVPADLPGRDEMYPDPDEWVNTGDSLVVAPDGRVVAGPLNREYGVVRATIDLAATDSAHQLFDAAGHYSRPDIFQLHIDRRPRDQAVFRDA